MRTFNRKKSETKDLDQLTGVLKRDVAEMEITRRIKERRSGALFLCDINHLKRINKQYGHLAGDECLKRAAQILSYMIQQDDILGRCGGDEFLIFMSGCRAAEQAEEICARIEKRFHASGGIEKSRTSFSVTVVWTLWQPEDTCRRLMKRVAAELEACKPKSTIPVEKKDNYAKDVRKIRQELIEQIQKPGAYCRDYETFKSIYRFLERGIIRGGQKACVILLTVVDEQGESLHPYEKDVLMEQLGEDIGKLLRVGDVYTKYSSSQYLALVIDTTEGQADMIVDRIRERFLENRFGNDILIHHCYELQPAQIGKQIG